MFSCRFIVLLIVLSVSFALPNDRADTITNPWAGGSTELDLKDKYGIGTCPNVDPIKDVDVDGMMGIWYVHYHQEPARQNMTCGKWRIDVDGEVRESGLPCQLKIARGGNENGKFMQVSKTTMFVKSEESGQKQLILDTPGTAPVRLYALEADYDEYMLLHACEEFPGEDFPVKLHYQHNFVLRRDRKEITPETAEAIRKVYINNGIDFDKFIKMDQKGCVIVKPRIETEPDQRV